MSLLPLPRLSLAIAAAASFAANAVAVENNISSFSFSEHVGGPVLTNADLSGRVVGVFAPCNF